MDMVRESAGIKATSSKKKSKDNCVWVKPPNSSLKFNIDSVARGCPGPSGIGGALRDHNGCAKIHFAKPLGKYDSNMAKFLALKRSFFLFVASSWSANVLFILSLLNQTHLILLNG
ncbi:Uncharacterized protein TCM_046027 [Theobroma cacao]|uniref:RNase H type-1 domain-containing protein n=1 Tax=Theobroma cacao TaxID=3641 RepID=S1RTY9_THECC|nr:Uncharacterized protein TCM_046027 [Theobroma cacao]